jgi:hypothetical protein
VETLHWCVVIIINEILLPLATCHYGHVFELIVIIFNGFKLTVQYKEKVIIVFKQRTLLMNLVELDEIAHDIIVKSRMPSEYWWSNYEWNQNYTVLRVWKRGTTKNTPSVDIHLALKDLLRVEPIIHSHLRL